MEGTCRGESIQTQLDAWGRAFIGQMIGLTSDPRLMRPVMASSWGSASHDLARRSSGALLLFMPNQERRTTSGSACCAGKVYRNVGKR